MRAGMYITDEEEAELREKWGYNDSEIELVNKSAQTQKMAEAMRADAAHSALTRRTAHLKPQSSAD